MSEPTFQVFPTDVEPPNSSAKSPFWTRRKTGIVAGVAGLLIGFAAGGGSGEESKPTAALLTPTQARSQTDDAVAGAKAVLEKELAAKQAELDTLRSGAASAQAAAVAQAVEEARADEQAKAAAAIAEAERRAAAAKAQAAEAKAAQPKAKAQPFAGGGSTDPRFGTCGEANDAGFGPYIEGADPEYDWYQDRDGDGRVCES